MYYIWHNGNEMDEFGIILRMEHVLKGWLYTLAWVGMHDIICLVGETWSWYGFERNSMNL